MRKSIFLFLPVLLLCLAILFLQPLRLISADSTRLTFHVGKTIPVTAIAEVAGGYRCYVNETEYFWVSAGDSEKHTGDEISVEFRLQKPVIIYMEEP